MEYTDNRKFIEVYVCQNRRNRLSSDKDIAKIKRCSFLPHMVNMNLTQPGGHM